MNEVDSFDLNDVHLAAPHTRFLVQATQKKANIIARQTQEIHQAISSVYHAQVTLTESYRNLSSVLRSTASGCAELSEPGEQYKQFNFQFVSVMDEIIELHQAMCTDLQSSVLDRLQEYVDFFSGLPYLANSVEICDKSRDQAFHTFMKLPKKTNLKTLQTALLELATFRREYERTATMYYGYLNQAERLREIIPLLTMIGFLERYAQHMKTMAKLTSSEMAVTLLELIQSTLQRKLDDESTMSTRFTNRADELRFESLSKFCSDPWLLTPDMSGDLHPNIIPQPNRKLQSKCGRLLMRTRVNLVWRWVEVFCHTQAGSLMSQQYGEIGASLLVDLSQKGVYTEAVDCDDRRNVFQIVSPTINKMVILQAESQLDRDEWIYTLTNVIFDVNSWEARRLSGDAVGGASTLKVSHATPPPACAPCSTDAWYFTCLPPVCFTLPTLPELTASRDAELLQVHCLSSAPPTSVTQESGPSGSQPRNDELLMVEKEDIVDPLLDLGFLGSLELPQNFACTNSSQFPDIFSYILSCRSASEMHQPSACHLLITKRDAWLLAGEQPTDNSPAGLGKRADVLVRVPFTNFRGWLIYPENPRLACLLVQGPLVDTATFAQVNGQICLAFESDKNQLVAEQLLSAQLEQIDTLNKPEDEAEKKQLMANISHLSDAACGPTNSAISENDAPDLLATSLGHPLP